MRKFFGLPIGFVVVIGIAAIGFIVFVLRNIVFFLGLVAITGFFLYRSPIGKQWLQRWKTRTRRAKFRVIPHKKEDAPWKDRRD